MSDIESRRLPQWLSLAAALLVLMAGGCQPERTRPTVGQLFEEALASSRVLHEDPAEVAAARMESNIALARARQPLGGEATGTDEGPSVSDTFIETDVQQALQSLAAQARVSLIIDEQVRGIITATIDDEPLEAALRKVLLPLGFVHRKVGSQYFVGVSDPNSALFPYIAERHEYAARHSSPREMMELMPDSLKPFIRASERRNVLIVEAPRAIAQRILYELGQSDAAAPQVVLEAMVVVYAPEDAFRFGFDFEQGIKVSGNEAINLGLQGLAMSGAVGPGQLEGLRNFTFTSAVLRAMAREGYISIRAAPRVMAKNGEKARISIGRETFFTIQPDTATLLIRQDLERVESGITLDITPVIRGDTVTVMIDRAEVSEDIRGSALRTADDRFPTINRRSVSTTVHVQDGQTIVIGGLVQRQEIDRVDKVPLLGDVPGLGLLFQNIDRQSQEAEVAIFISPRIVRGG
jgi:type IV pilus assembly protein PilQ